LSCETLGRFRGPFITDPFVRAQMEVECNGAACSINGSSCVVGRAIVDCATVDDLPDGFPVDY
jgi:hypothetical protein